MVKKTNSGAVVGIIAGGIIIVLAIVMLSGANNISASDLSKSSQFQLSYSFGADFYTEMYGVTYSILQQLGDMSGDYAVNMARVANTVTASLGYVILAIGIGVLGLSFCKLNVWIPAESDHVLTEEPQLMDSAIDSKTESEEEEAEEILIDSSESES